MLEIRLLGQFSVRLDQQPVDIPSRPAQSVLAYLVLNAGTAQRREKLAGMFWPDTTESNARSNLRHALWRIRKSLGKPHGNTYLLADNISIAFNTDTDYWVDADILAQNGGIEHSIDKLLTEVKEYGGELLPGFYEDWVVLERERLRALYETKIQKLLDLLVNAGRWGEILEWSERWIAQGQAPEPAFRALMLAYHGLGDTASSAATYQRCREALQSYLGVEPSNQTQEIYVAVSAGRPPPVSLWVSEVKPSPASSTVAIQSLLKGWRGQTDKILDIPTMAVIYAGRGDIQIAPEDARLLIRSALQHGVDVAPWVRRAGTPQVASAALKQILDTYPRPRIRMKIVEALKALPVDEADDILLEIASTDDAASVRTEAAVAASQRGHVETVATNLLTTIKAVEDPGALSALVAVADEIGLPKNVGAYPILSLALGVGQRRWQAKRGEIFQQCLRASFGAAFLLALHGALAPFYVAIWSSDVYQETLALISLLGWMLSGALGMLFIGGIQGLVSGFTVGLADTLFRGNNLLRWRIVCGSIAGLVESGLLFLFTAADLPSPRVGPEIYVPVFILYGLTHGAMISMIIPRLGTFPAVKQQYQKYLYVALGSSLIVISYVFLTYPENPGSVLPDRLATGLLMPLGITLALSKFRKSMVPHNLQAARNM
jgi:DNA-binding SARP family transcriptional activator